MKTFFKMPIEFRNGYKDRKRLAAVGLIKCIVCSNEGIAQQGRLEIHHFTGCGLGKKASDLLTLPLCFTHHQKYKDDPDPNKKALSIHGLTEKFEAAFGTQEQLLKQVNKKLGDEERYKIYWEIRGLND